MACYSQWTTYLVPGTQGYDERLTRLRDVFASLRYMVDYYLSVFGRALPAAKYDGNGSNYRLLNAADELTEDQYDALCLHMAGDGVHQDDIYDIESILDKEASLACAYLYVLMRCASRLRSMTHRYCQQVRRQDDETLLGQAFKGER